jgi:hypothetical protein
MMSTDKPSETQTAAKTLLKTAVAPKVSTAKAASPSKAPKTVSRPKVAKSPSVTQVAAKSAPKVDIKPAKIKKAKLVRDSLTMPKVEYEVLDLLKTRAAMLQSHVKKTELIRAGIKALAAMTDAVFLAAIKAVPNLKTGRPKKS